jgi:hypothetical protein
MRKTFVLLAILGVAWFQSLWAATHGIQLSWQESTPGTSFIIYRGPFGKPILIAAAPKKAPLPGGRREGLGHLAPRGAMQDCASAARIGMVTRDRQTWMRKREGCE